MLEENAKLRWPNSIYLFYVSYNPAQFVGEEPRLAMKVSLESRDAVLLLANLRQNIQCVENPLTKTETTAANGAHALSDYTPHPQKNGSRFLNDRAKCRRWKAISASLRMTEQPGRRIQLSG